MTYLIKYFFKVKIKQPIIISKTCKENINANYLLD